MPQEATMRGTMVRYRLVPDQVEHNEALVRAVYDELRRTAPPGFRYATFRDEDGTGFVHLATLDDPRTESPLGGVAAFQAFRAGIAERCVEPPVTTALRLVGSYAMLDAGAGR